MKYICQGPPMVKKNSKVNQSTQHKFRNKIIINTLWESLSILWIIGRAVPDGGHFSSWAFWVLHPLTQETDVRRLSGRLQRCYFNGQLF